MIVWENYRILEVNNESEFEMNNQYKNLELTFDYWLEIIDSYSY
jgi:hypothetical protein